MSYLSRWAWFIHAVQAETILDPDVCASNHLFTVLQPRALISANAASIENESSTEMPIEIEYEIVETVNEMSVLSLKA